MSVEAAWPFAILFWVVLLKVLLKILKGQLIATFVFSIIFRFLLNRIVGKVYEFVIKVIRIIFFRSSSEVSILVEISISVSVYSSQEGESPDVKFPTVYQQRIADILLDNIRVPDSCVDISLDLGNFIINRDVLASVAVFTWFSDP